MVGQDVAADLGRNVRFLSLNRHGDAGEASGVFRRSRAPGAASTERGAEPTKVVGTYERIEEIDETRRERAIVYTTGVYKGGGHI
jgi:hypothetical protein